ncbi:unnamed protein product [Mytilus coruscus]|uniref:SWIM-type domain-containing protein n=1 Tax=Mytilus coruscus TaxID=42192 RepID=A0A6J8D757_MYTCO|nr:unnamed protein product [Mytilus coruscus]
MCTEDGFNVKSPDSDNQYNLSINTGGPYCSCLDWKKNHWPCKHLLVLFTQYPGYGWDFLPPEYKTQPLFNLDSELTDKAVFSDSKVNIVDESIASETVVDIEIPDLVQEECQTSITELKEIKKGKKCLIAIKQIRNGVYSVSSLETLYNVHKMLMNVDSFLEGHIPKLSGLPIRTNIPGQKRKNEETEFVSSNMPDLIETENLEKYEQDVDSVQHAGSCITLDSEEEEVSKGDVDSSRNEVYNVQNSGRPVEEEEIEDALPKKGIISK